MIEDKQQLIIGSVEVLDQLLDFIADLKEDDYNRHATPVFDSSIGEHVRHVCDMYHVLKASYETNKIDYNFRRRGSSIESNLEVGTSEIHLIKSWLLNLAIDHLEAPLDINLEVAVTNTVCVQIPSNLARELSATSSHLTHHLAYMASIAKYLGCHVDKKIGVAPATMTSLRAEAQNEKTNICAQ